MEERRAGERIATLEADVRTHQGEIDSLRDTRHEHANVLQQHELRIEWNEKAVEAMTNQVVPAIHRTLEQQATEIANIGNRQAKTRMDFGWVMRILTFVLLFVVAIAEGVIVYKLTDGRAAQAAPISNSRKP